MIKKIVLFVCGMFCMLIMIMVYGLFDDDRPREIRYLEDKFDISIPGKTVSFYNDGMVEGRKGEFHYIVKISDSKQGGIVEQQLSQKDNWAYIDEVASFPNSYYKTSKEFDDILTKCLKENQTAGYYYYRIINKDQMLVDKYTRYIISYYNISTYTLYYAEVIF